MKSSILKKKRSILIHSILVIVTGIIIIKTIMYRSETGKLQSISFKTSISNLISTQDTNKRLVTNIKVKRLNTFSPYRRDIFQSPRVLKITNNGVYVLDISSLFSFSYDFTSMHIFGNRMEPGALSHPYDFSITANGDAFITNIGTSTITLYNKKAGFVKSIKVPHKAIIKIVALNDSIFVIASGRGELMKLNTYGKIITTYEPFFESNTQSELFEDLSICTDNDGTIYGAFWHGGYIFCFNSLGKIKFLTETIDHFPFANYNIRYDNKGNKITSIDHYSPISALGISYYDDTLYVFAGSASIKEKGIIIDAYLALNGKYLFSYKYHRPSDVYRVVSCSVFKKKLYAIERLTSGEYRFVSYQIEFSSPKKRQIIYTIRK